jgi:hypothetical protein
MDYRIPLAVRVVDELDTVVSPSRIGDTYAEFQWAVATTQNYHSAGIGLQMLVKFQAHATIAYVSASSDRVDCSTMN